MRSPEGQEFDGGAECYLESSSTRSSSVTNALEPGFRPARQSPEAGDADLVFTAVITLEPHGTGTKYTAIAIHRDEVGREKHEQMGFHEGCGAALD